MTLQLHTLTRSRAREGSGMRPVIGRAVCAAFVLSAVCGQALSMQPVEETTGPGLTSDAPAETRVIMPNPDRDGQPYEVSSIDVEFVFDHPDNPDPEELLNVQVPLVATPDGYIGPVQGVQPELVRLGDIGGPGTVLWGSAVASVTQSIRDYMEAEYGWLGHLVAPDLQDIRFESTQEDIRAVGDTSLTIDVWRAVVGEMRTIGFGQRWDSRELEAERVNLYQHRDIRRFSQIEQGDILRSGPVDDYVYQLNRHPGRRVDVAIAPISDEDRVLPGEVTLDYLVTEAKPWAAYYQISNTGTESTDEWQHRFGFYHNQLTNNDDIFRVDYITSGFDETHAVIGSYDFPIIRNVLRGNVFARWSEYTASDVGLAADTFTGEGYELGFEAALTVAQSGPLFLDAFAGMRYEFIDVENQLTLIEGSEGFLLGSVGLRLERDVPTASTFAELRFEGSLAEPTDAEAATLGRFDVDADFAVLRGVASHSFFLEPLINPSGFTGDDPDQWTLAHEIALIVQGQVAFGNRLVPNYEQVAGGFYTVRGYDESVAVGDNAIIATAEYRFHLGRAVPQTNQVGTVFGRPFRFARTTPYGSADWDVILRSFVDVARLTNNDALPFETNDTLIGVGVGVEVQVKNSLAVRLDYGIALEEVEGRVDEGDSRLHFSASVLF